MRHFNRLDRQPFQRCARQRSHFTRNAEDAQTVAQIRREFQREDAVIEPQPLADVGAYRRIAAEFQQTTVIFGDLQFTGRAQHAQTFHATQLAHTDLEGLAVFTGWQFCADHSQRHLDAHTRVRCAADDLQRAVFAEDTSIDRAHTQAVGLRVLLGRQDLGHHHATERRRHRADLFYFHAGHGEQLAQRLGVQRRVTELTQPGFGELHDQLNCLRNRRSPSNIRRRSSMP